MTVCLEYQPAVAQTAGIGRYVGMLAQNLLATAREDELLRLFCLDFRRRLRRDGLERAEWRVCRLLPGCLMQRLWNEVGFPPFDWLAGAADLYHFTNFIRPPLGRGKSVVTVFDMSFERYPACAEERNLRYLRDNLKRTVAQADAILTISEFSAREIEQLLPAARHKTVSIPLGIDGSFRRPDPGDIAALRKTLGLDRPYLLTVGTIEPRKNLDFLVDVFEDLDVPGLELVVAGKPGWKCGPILERFRTSRCADRIRYVRYVPDKGLAALYGGAELVLVPSLYEGFGFPPLEAMACGTPVVSSEGGSLPEILGQAALIVPGFEVDSWKEAIEALLSDSARREAMIRAGIGQAALYRWEKTARKTWDLYRSLTS